MSSKKTVVCHDCGNWCGSGRKRCLECRNKHKKHLKEQSLLATKNTSTYNHGHISNRYAKIRYHARHDYESLLITCEICGYSKHVEICHIKPIKDFDENATIQEINSRSNIIGLCPNCHWEFDHGMIDLNKK